MNIAAYDKTTPDFSESVSGLSIDMAEAVLNSQSNQLSSRLSERRSKTTAEPSVEKSPQHPDIYKIKGFPLGA